MSCRRERVELDRIVGAEQGVSRATSCVPAAAQAALAEQEATDRAHGAAVEVMDLADRHGAQPSAALSSAGCAGYGSSVIVTSWLPGRTGTMWMWPGEPA